MPRFALLFITVTLSHFSSYAQFHVLDYEIPAYIDFEFSEITVQENQPVAVIHIHRSGDFRQYTRVQFVTEEMTATEGQDYKGTGGTITFQPGEGIKQIEIPLIADGLSESDETFRLVLSEPSANTLLTRDSITVTIHDTPAPVAAPKLEIASAGSGKIALSWEGEPTCRLERTADAVVGNWEVVTRTPKVDGTRCEVIEPIGGVIYFYRLRVD